MPITIKEKINIFGLQIESSSNGLPQLLNFPNPHFGEVDLIVIVGVLIGGEYD